MPDYKINLSKNAREIIQLLLTEEAPLTIEKIMHIAKRSKRMVYYDFDNVKYWIKSINAGSLDSDSGVYALTDEQKFKVQKYLKESDYITEKEDRIAYIICTVICSDKEIRLDALMNKFGISKNAALYDLTEAKKILSEYQLTLMNSKKSGYYTEGNILRKWSVFSLYISKLIKHTGMGSIGIFDQEKIDAYYTRLKDVVSQLEINLSEAKLAELTYLLLAIKGKLSNYQLQIVDLEYIKNTKELKLIDEQFQELCIHERIYLAVCLLNNKEDRNFLKNSHEIDLCLQDCAVKLVENFEMAFCVDFDRRDELIYSIYMHMKLSYNNYCYLIPNTNPLFNEIKENYLDLYNMVKLCCVQMKEEFPYFVDENEITYLTMHFGSFMHSARKESSHANVIITCPNLTTSSRLLKKEIEDRFDNITVVDIVKYQKINEYPSSKKIDFVISTVNFECRFPMILVHPILTAEDRANIASLMMLLNIDSKTDSQQFKTLLKIVRRNVDDETYIRIKKKLNDYLNSEGTLMNIPENRQITLYDMLEQYGVKIKENPEEDWVTAIRETAEPLLQKKCVREEYVDKIIDLGRKHGPYFVISEKIAIAHAKPDDGVIKMGVSLSIYKKGLKIMGKNNVQFLFILSTPNQQEHLHILQNIVSVNEDEKIMNQMIQAECEEDALYILKKELG